MRLAILPPLAIAGCSYAATIDHVPDTGARLDCQRTHDERDDQRPEIR